MHEQAKALRKSHEALHDINVSPQYDENRVKGLADSAAKAESQMTVLRVRTGHDLYALLTPEQKKQLEERRREHGPGERGRPWFVGSLRFLTDRIHPMGTLIGHVQPGHD
jgi:Spy/CpxP family protein refolding chaperone